MAQLVMLKLKDLKMDEKFYPRNKINWLTAYRYAEAMKSGSVFPPITVAKLEDRLIVVDGWHRITALERNKEKYVQAEILKGLTPAQIFAQAVIRNNNHGYQLTSSELVKCITTLKEFKFSMIEISRITHIAVEKIEPFIAKRITNTVTGETVILKKGNLNMAGITVEDSFGEMENGLSGLTQGELIDNLIDIVQSGTLNIDNKYIIKRANILYQLLGEKLIAQPTTELPELTLEPEEKGKKPKKGKKSEENIVTYGSE